MTPFAMVQGHCDVDDVMRVSCVLRQTNYTSVSPMIVSVLKCSVDMVTGPIRPHLLNVPHSDDEVTSVKVPSFPK
ncbi:hypothetical protein TNCV_4471201 [Trichonephila clavipes]|uniref:Uncharacterized protein n=1 Tax=Trichonephila clavipes TaxID=2585209 RepID=A0A8X6VFV1_TRICX|nr:hypothetical protein TNCV_4471201 [Trichonephila clavipes]